MHYFQVTADDGTVTWHRIVQDTGELTTCACGRSFEDSTISKTDTRLPDTRVPTCEAITEVVA